MEVDVYMSVIAWIIIPNIVIHRMDIVCVKTDIKEIDANLFATKVIGASNVTSNVNVKMEGAVIT